MTTADRRKNNHLVIDLKRLSRERVLVAATEAEVALKNKKDSSLQKERSFFNFSRRLKGDREINFIDRENFCDLDEYDDRAGAEKEFDPESARSLKRAFAERNIRDYKQPLSEIIWSLFWKPFWLPVFLVRFVWFFFFRLFCFVFRRARKPSAVLEKKQLKNFPETSLDLSSRTAKEAASEKESLKEDLLPEEILLEKISKKEGSPAKQAFAFACLIFILVLPFKVFSYYQAVKVDDLEGQVLGAAEEAIGSLRSAGGFMGDREMLDASLSFSRAGDNFRQAREQIEVIDDLALKLAKFAPNKDLKLASASKDILILGEEASSLGTNLSIAFDGFMGDSADDLATATEKFLKYEKRALENSLKIKETISRVDANVLPAEYRETFLLLKEKAADLEMTLGEIADLAEKIKIFLGFEKDKRYLFLFENNDEMRAAGGFIGSYALVDFSKGKIKNIEIPGGGSYDTEGGLREAVVSPEPLHLVNPLWHFWDANWWPDWEKSAKKLAWFYENSGGPTVDGCIAITPTVLERILRLTGPIDMSDTYGLVMDADNFWSNIRDEIEKEKIADQTLGSAAAENKPKKIIGEFFQRLMVQLPKSLNKETAVKFLSITEKSLEEKHILFYFRDQELQQEARDRGWAGKIEETNKDYLMVVNSNIAGGKSDKRMKEVIDHEVEVLADDSIVDTLKIKRIHTGNVDEAYYGVRNVDWMRIYVPQGSELLEAAGFRGPDPVYFDEPEADWEADPDVLAEESGMVIKRDCQNTYVYEESGKTVFANWSMVDPGNSAEIYLKYKLPFKIEDKEGGIKDEGRLTEIFNRVMNVEKKALYPYSLLVQKQPGSRFTIINSKFRLSDDFSAIWKYPNTLEMSVSGWEVKEDLNSDRYWALLAEKKDK